MLVNVLGQTGGLVCTLEAYSIKFQLRSSARLAPWSGRDRGRMWVKTTKSGRRAPRAPLNLRERSHLQPTFPFDISNKQTLNVSRISFHIRSSTNHSCFCATYFKISMPALLKSGVDNFYGAH